VEHGLPTLRARRDAPPSDADGSTEVAMTECSQGTPDDEPEGPDDGHLQEVESGAGCTEIWEYLSERREDDD
jgi:hypothetical protein